MASPPFGQPAVAPPPAAQPPRPPQPASPFAPPPPPPPGYGQPFGAPPPQAPPPQFAAPQQPRPPAAAPFGAPPPGQPGYAPTPPYGAQPYGAPPYGAPPAAASPFSPNPPNLHWALVWLLGFFTGGLFIFIWFCIQAGYVAKIDKTSKARMLIVLAVLLIVAYMAVSIGVIAMGSQELAIVGALLGFAMMIGSVVCNLMAVFGMRSSLVRHFNTVEPIGLRLSGVMTFFFNVLYFQYHFSRIAEWKRTGMLQPQG